MVFVGRYDRRSAIMRGDRVICVVGPTAVGKSGVAEQVALRLGGAVVSVDSMQVYRGMDIGTAKVPKENRHCPLYMVDVAEVGEPYSVARFQAEARQCVDALQGNGEVPILCGGTGLYLDAVIDKMSFPHGQTRGSKRLAYEEYAKVNGTQALHDLLKLRDEQSALEIHPNNVRRVVRALEMLEEGTSYATHHKGLKNRAPHYEARIWALTLPREELYKRIDKRVDQMFEQGLADEVRRLKDKGILNSPTASKAIGYKELIAALDGECSFDEARDLIKRNTRRYAKRQLSWLRRDMRATWLNMNELSSQEAVNAICDDWGTAQG